MPASRVLLPDTCAWTELTSSSGRLLTLFVSRNVNAVKGPQSPRKAKQCHISCPRWESC